MSEHNLNFHRIKTLSEMKEILKSVQVDLRMKKANDDHIKSINFVPGVGTRSRNKTESTPNQPRCAFCNAIGHTADKCLKAKMKNPPPKCHNCGILGHLAKDCRKPGGGAYQKNRNDNKNDNGNKFNSVNATSEHDDDNYGIPNIFSTIEC